VEIVLLFLGSGQSPELLTKYNNMYHSKQSEFCVDFAMLESMY